LNLNADFASKLKKIKSGNMKIEQEIRNFVDGRVISHISVLSEHRDLTMRQFLRVPFERFSETKFHAFHHLCVELFIFRAKVFNSVFTFIYNFLWYPYVYAFKK
jgi:hypothetical protein